MYINNNRKIILKISNSISSNNKLRNIFIILAITLTTALLAMGFTSYYSVVDTLAEYESSNSNDDNINTFLRSSYGDGEVYKVDSLTIPNDEVIKSNYTFDAYYLKNIYLKIPNNKNFFEKTNINILSGELPQSTDEIILPSSVVDNIKNIHTGDEIIVSNGKDEIQGLSSFSKNYKITGVYKSEDGLASDLYTGPVSVTQTSLSLIIIIILLVMLSGYLFIYNILYIHVIKDFKAYKMLRILGMKAKEIKWVIFYQGLKFSVVGVPLGITIGIEIGEMITPMVIKFTGYEIIPEVTNKLAIYIIPALIMVFVIYLSSLKPSIYASDIDLIKTIDDSYINIGNKLMKREFTKRQTKVKLMSWLNIFRNKKKTYLTFSSLILGALVIIFSISAYLSLSPRKAIKGNITSDLAITHNSTIISNSKYIPVGKELTSELEKLEFIEDINYQYEAINPNDSGVYDYFYGEVVRTEPFKVEGKVNNKSRLEASYGKIGPEKQITNNENVFPLRIKGISYNDFDREIGNYKLIHGAINKEKFFADDYVIFLGTNTFKANTQIPITFIVSDITGEIKNVTKDLDVMSIIKFNTSKIFEDKDSIRELIISDKLFNDIYGEKENYITNIDITFKEGYENSECEKEIATILHKFNNDQLTIKSRKALVSEVSELQRGISRIGVIISSIVGLIAILNVINSSLASLFARQAEFAILRAIGTTRRQMKEMIIQEGFYSFLIVAIPLVPLGFITGKLPELFIPFAMKVSFTEVSISVIIACILVLIINICIPYLGYKLIFKKNLSEDLKEIIWY
ncbi:FtsX-like permease family protein [Clostridium paraputrificum]|uniref:ABC transporter permease n=1 Tax=Clostridium paraputrificum TaxID=29363 RepID=UPI003D327F5B